MAHGTWCCCHKEVRTIPSPLSGENNYSTPLSAVRNRPPNTSFYSCSHFARQGTLTVTRSSLTPLFRYSFSAKGVKGASSLGHASTVQTVHSVQADDPRTPRSTASLPMTLLSDRILAHFSSLPVTLNFMSSYGVRNTLPRSNSQV